MSKDIRSFFSVISKKPGNGTSKLPGKHNAGVNPIDSDSEEVIKGTPDKNAPKKHSVKRRPQILNSDSEDEGKPETKKKHSKSPSKKVKTEPKLKPVNIDDVFKNTPVKQAKVAKIESTVREENQKQNKQKKPKKNTELGVHNDKDFEQTLLELDNDDDVLLNNLDVLDKTIEEAEKSKTSKTEKTFRERNSIESHEKKEENKKRQRRNSSSDSKRTPSKKQKLEQIDSGIDQDQERWEKRRHSAALYQKYLNRGGPKHHGSKELPKGTENCLGNLTFLRTGVLDSLDSDEFDNLVKEHGGRTVHAVSKKVNFIVVGEEPGPAKLEKARNYNIPEISEDEFLDLILVKSGLKPKYCTKVVSEDLGIVSGNDSPFRPSVNETIDLESIVADSSKKPKLKKSDSDSIKINSEITKKTDCQKKDEIKPTKPEKQENSNLCMSWTEKYKPSDLKAIIGQQDSNSNMNKLKKWLEKWYHNQKPEVRNKLPKPTPWNQFDGAYYKCALLSGPPGVGKTTTASLVSKELGFDIVEFNASDTRNKKLLHEEISQMMNMGSVAGFAAGDVNSRKKRVLVMDEVDGMAGNEDRGGIAELINFIKTAKFPIICICNDRNHPKMRTLVNYCYGLKFGKPSVQQIRGAMLSVCYKEGLKIKPEALSELISGTGCDIRQTLNNLFMWSAVEKNLSDEMVHKESQKSQKDVVLGPWDVVRKVFNESENMGMSLIDKSRLFFYDYSLGPLFIQENYPTVQPSCISKNKEKECWIRLMRTADSLSLSDLIESKIRSTNNWSLLESQAFFSTVFPSYYMSGSMSKCNFPGWFGKNSKRNKALRIISELHSHTRTSTSSDKMSFKLDYARPLYESIVTPLLKNGIDGIGKSLDIMKSYSLLREDLNNLVDLCQGFGNKNIFNDVESKVKSAFTRAYNKEVLLPFAPPIAPKKKKSAEDAELMGEEEEEEEEELDGEKESIEADTMIKIKAKKKATTTDTKKGGKAGGSTKRTKK